MPSAGQCRGDFEALGQHGRHVLGTVDRQIDIAAQQRFFDLLDEETFSSRLGEGCLLKAISARGDVDQLGRAAV